MPQLTYEEYYLNLTRLVSSRSTCYRRAVGAIITDERHRVLSMGYNGVPSSFPHCRDSVQDRCPGALDGSGDNTRCEAVHAEVNAVLQCTRLDLARILYVSCAPCFSCAKMLANTPITSVICLEPYVDQGAALLGRAGISIKY